MTGIRAVLYAGTCGGLAMVPVGLVIRRVFGGAVNVYGELLVERVLGYVAPWALFVEHFVISWMFAAPVVLWASRWPARRPALLGLLYGVGIWAVVNSVMLPWLFGRPTPWVLGWHAMWPSLTVHAVYGVVTAYVIAMPVDPAPRLKQRGGANAW